MVLARLCVIAAMAASLSAYAGDSPKARQRISVTAARGSGLAVSTMTNTQTATPLRDYGTWVGISKDELHGLVAGRFK